jgi:hypothetical protein
MGEWSLSWACELPPPQTGTAGGTISRMGGVGSLYAVLSVDLITLQDDLVALRSTILSL